ncbi:MAG: DUF1330 domain-containing protein [Rhodothermales bacterium]
MPAYVLVEVDIRDTSLYEQYKALTPATLAQYGGHFLVRGGEVAPLEGAPPAGRVVVLEFEDMDAAKRWWSSPEYEAAKALRHQAATTRLFVVEGA